MLNVLKWCASVMILVLISYVAQAQSVQPQQQIMDQRLLGPTIEALQAMLNLRETELKVMSEGYEARLETAMQWLKTAQDATKQKK